jgi:aerobic-type carbon monoxide dehydrogenase small subunit (CoxS/CutS family)
MTNLEITLNGAPRSARVAPETTLLELLRETFGLTGAKRGCDVGDCGACTVLLDGQPVNACLVIALQAHGRSIVTIEGLATHRALHPLQEAFEAHAALQCGFCGPGVILSAKALLDENGAPSTEEIREALAGHLCRCTGYSKMIEAVSAAAQSLASAAPSGEGPPAPAAFPTAGDASVR